MKQLDDLISKFEKLVIDCNEAYQIGDYRTANKKFKHADRCICEIQQFTNWVEALSKFMSHEVVYVRVKTASILLPYDTKNAEKTLKKCSHFSGIDGLNAKTTLQEWQSGQLKFPKLENGKVIYVGFPLD